MNNRKIFFFLVIAVVMLRAALCIIFFPEISFIIPITVLLISFINSLRNVPGVLPSIAIAEICTIILLIFAVHLY